MKKIKIFTIAVALMLGVGGAGAQTTGSVDNTFCFLDADGNEVKDGSTVTFYAEDTPDFPGYPEWGTTLKADFALKVKNTTSSVVAVAARIITEELSNGSVQFCFPNQCQTGTLPSDYTSDCRDILANEEKVLGSEWMPEAGKYGEARFTLQLLVVNRRSDTDFDIKAYGPKITIHCIYADPTGIEDVTTSGKDATEVSRYDASGRKLSAPAKGLNIVKLSDGRTVKIRN